MYKLGTVYKYKQEINNNYNKIGQNYNNIL